MLRLPARRLLKARPHLCLAKIMICRSIRQIRVYPVSPVLPCQTCFMLRLLRLLFVLAVRSVHSRRNLLLENLALRQQLGVLKGKRTHVRFTVPDKVFWVMLRRLWPGWKRTLVLVQPETVVRWHRAGFKLYWKWISRHRTRAGGRCVSPDT